MDTNNCKLQMNELFFSKYNFTHTHTSDDNEYKTSFQIEYAVNSHDPSKFKVTINTAIKNSEESVMLNLETIGIFTLEDTTDSDNEHLIKVNTVAIMFPFIRSQISLLTTQPGMKPILLPPININAIMSSATTTKD